MASKKLVLDLLEQEVEDFIQTQAEKVIEFEDDPMAYILQKYPSLNDTLTDLMTKHFGDYVTGIYVMAPKPTTFKILLHNGQFYYLIYAKDSYIAKILGKKYYLLDLGAEEYALIAPQTRCAVSLSPYLFKSYFGSTSIRKTPWS